MSSSELVSLLRELQQAADEHERRLATLEQAPLAFTMAEWIDQRRKVHLRMRVAGLSIDRIAQATGSPKSTVARDVEAIAPDIAGRIVGVDGRRYRSRHAQGNGNGTNGRG